MSQRRSPIERWPSWAMELQRDLDGRASLCCGRAGLAVCGGLRAATIETESADRRGRVSAWLWPSKDFGPSVLDGCRTCSTAQPRANQPAAPSAQHRACDWPIGQRSMAVRAYRRPRSHVLSVIHTRRRPIPNTYKPDHERRSPNSRLVPHCSLLLLQHRARRPLLPGNSLAQPRLRLPALHTLRPDQPAAGLPPSAASLHDEPLRCLASPAAANTGCPPPGPRAHPATAHLEHLLEQLQQLHVEHGHGFAVHALLLPLPPRVPGEHVPDRHQPLLLQPLRTDDWLQRWLKPTSASNTLYTPSPSQYLDYRLPSSSHHYCTHTQTSAVNPRHVSRFAFQHRPWSSARARNMHRTLAFGPVGSALWPCPDSPVS